MQSRLTKPSLLVIFIQLPVVFLAWPVANLASWLKWQVHHEVVVPMWCKLAKLADSAAFRWALWAIIMAELYMVYCTFFSGKIVANAVF